MNWHGTIRRPNVTRRLTAYDLPWTFNQFVQFKSWCRREFKSESGSAIVEFVALAIPLFIPIFIYLNHFSSVSINEEIARSMAREVLRVYVLGDGDSSARELSSKATQLFAQEWKLSSSELASLRTRLDCTNDPCLAANARIKLTVSFTDDQTGREISASAQEHLSPWVASQ